MKNTGSEIYFKILQQMFKKRMENLFPEKP